MAPEGASRCRAGASGLTGPVGGFKCHVSCESARNLWSGPAEVKECGRNPEAFLRPLVRLPGLPGSARLPRQQARGGTRWPCNIGRAALAGRWLAADRRPPAAQAAQTYPNRQVTFVVPYAAGGGLDVFARQLGAEALRAARQAVRDREPPRRRHRHRRRLTSPRPRPTATPSCSATSSTPSRSTSR